MPIFSYRIQGLVCIVLFFSTIMPAHAQIDMQLDAKLQASIKAVRSAKSPNARYDAAEQLPALTSKSCSGSVADSTVTQLIALLNDPDDGVRMFVAATLGNLQAKAAVPKLLALLRASDCLEGPVTSARSIRFALERIGVKPPPAPSDDDCQKAK